MALTIPSASLLQAETATPPTAPEPQPGFLGGSFLVPMVVIVGIFYFLLIRPEKRKQQERERVLKSIKKGDKVMTTGGMYGSVAAVQDDVLTLQVAEGVRVRFSRAAIQSVVESATEPAA